MTSLCSAFGSDTAAARARCGFREPPGDRVVVIWGVLLSMVLTLVVVPAVTQ